MRSDDPLQQCQPKIQRMQQLFPEYHRATVKVGAVFAELADRIAEIQSTAAEEPESTKLSSAAVMLDRATADLPPVSEEYEKRRNEWMASAFAMCECLLSADRRSKRSLDAVAEAFHSSIEISRNQLQSAETFNTSLHSLSTSHPQFIRSRDTFDRVWQPVMTILKYGVEYQEKTRDKLLEGR